MPSHYMNHWGLIANWTFRNTLQWNFNQNTIISFKKIHLKMVLILFRPQYVNLCSNQGHWIIISQFHAWSQYHAFWCPGATGHQGIKGRDIDCAKQAASLSAWEWNLQIDIVDFENYCTNGNQYFRNFCTNGNQYFLSFQTLWHMGLMG